MKILFAAINAKYVHTNIAVRYLSLYLKKQGFDVDFAEYTINEPKGSVLRKLYAANAAVYGFSCYIWNISEVLSLAEDLKKLKPQSKIVLGGPEVSFCGEELIEKYPFLDAVICGEGETAAAELFKTSDFERGVYRRKEKFDFKTAGFPYTDEDLEECIKGEKLIYYESSRGCPFSCSYCLSSVENGVRFLPLERVKSEIKKITDAGALTIKFVDRTFNADKRRALGIWRFCAALDGKTKYHFEIGADLLDEECIEFLKTVPKDKFLFEVGVQSTNEKTLGAVCRKTDLNKIKENVKALRACGNIHLHLDLIAGLPFEGYESFKKSFNDLFGLRPHELQLGFLKFLKGSGIRAAANSFGAVYSSSAPYEVLETEYLSAEEIIKLHSVEDVLERYYNSERFENSVFYAAELFDSPFDFFEKLSEFFEEKDLIERGVKRITLYGLLYDFIEQNTDEKECEEFRLRLKKDFELWHSNGVGTPGWYKK